LVCRKPGKQELLCRRAEKNILQERLVVLRIGLPRDAPERSLVSSRRNLVQRLHIRHFQLKPIVPLISVVPRRDIEPR
jgi:hypothetical protein